MVMAFLKDILKDGPITFEFIEIGPWANFKKKDGSYYEAAELSLKNRTDSKMSKEKIFSDRDHARIKKDFFPGNLIQAYLNEEGYVAWRKVATGEDALKEPTNNTRDVKQERAHSSNIDEQAERQWSIVLQAMVKTFGPGMMEKFDTAIPPHTKVDAIVYFSSLMAQKVQEEAKQLSKPKA